MSARISAARRAAFLKAVAETGNQVLAAERAKVSRSWVTLHRARDAQFDAAVRGAVAEARERLLSGPHPPAAPHPASGRGGSNKPASRWAFAAGEELVVRGGNGRRAQIARARLKQWSPSAEQRFLLVLRETASVKAGCAAVGLSQASAYNHRKRWPDFGNRWDETLDAAMDELEWALLKRARSPLSPAEPPPAGGPIREMTAFEALHLVEMHRRRRALDRNRDGLQSNKGTKEQLAAEIWRYVKAVERRRARGLATDEDA